MNCLKIWMAERIARREREEENENAWTAFINSAAVAEAIFRRIRWGSDGTEGERLDRAIKADKEICEPAWKVYEEAKVLNQREYEDSILRAFGILAPSLRHGESARSAREPESP